MHGTQMGREGKAGLLFHGFCDALRRARVIYEYATRLASRGGQLLSCVRCSVEKEGKRGGAGQEYCTGRNSKAKGDILKTVIYVSGDMCGFEVGSTGEDDEASQRSHTLFRRP